MALNREYYAIVDANANRAKEGLRVIEDISRFLLSDKKNTASLKALRHGVSKHVSRLSPRYNNLLEARDSEADVGRRANTKSEFKRGSVKEILVSNFKRVEESLRVLEEVSKLTNTAAAAGLKELRYVTYTLEKKILLKYRSNKNSGRK